MRDLSYGYKQPEDGDLGAIVFPALASNWALAAAHNHNGMNSAKLTHLSFNHTYVDFPSGIANDKWRRSVNGEFEQEKPLPSGVTLGRFIPIILITERNTVTVNEFFEGGELKVIGSAPNQRLHITVNDSSLALRVILV